MLDDNGIKDVNEMLGKLYHNYRTIHKINEPTVVEDLKELKDGKNPHYYKLREKRPPSFKIPPIADYFEIIDDVPKKVFADRALNNIYPNILVVIRNADTSGIKTKQIRRVLRKFYFVETDIVKEEELGYKKSEIKDIIERVQINELALLKEMKFISYIPKNHKEDTYEQPLKKDNYITDDGKKATDSFLRYVLSDVKQFPNIYDDKFSISRAPQFSDYLSGANQKRVLLFAKRLGRTWNEIFTSYPNLKVKFPKKLAISGYYAENKLCGRAHKRNKNKKSI